MSENGNIKVVVDSIISPCYESYLLKEAEKGQKERGYTHFHPSGFGGCLRKMALQYYGETDRRLREPRDFEGRVERIFRAGHAFHYRMQRECTEMGILKGYWRSKITGKVYGKEEKTGIFLPESLEAVGETTPEGEERSPINLFEYEEIRVKSEKYNFRGNCDGVVELEKGNPETIYVVDFKTVKAEKFAFIATKTRKPDTEYITQLNIYMWLLGLKKGIIFYEEKNTHQNLEFLVHLDEDLINQIKINSEKLLSFVKDKKLPKVATQYAKTKKPCCWCGYRDFCWKAKGD